MKLVDVNVLLYAVHEEAVLHRPARSWLDFTLSSSETVLMPWISLLAFIRLSTHPSAYSEPLSVAQAAENVEDWLGVPNVRIPEPDGAHLPRVRSLLEATGTGGNLVNDAHLAALALQYGATVASYDNDFGRFPNVRWERPQN